MQSENWSLDDLKEYECPICKNSFNIGLTYNDKHMCTKCYDKLMKDIIEGKSKMVKTLYSIYEVTANNPEGTWIPKDDYLKVVEEKENLKIKLDTVTTFRNGYYKEVEELKRENESLHENLERVQNHLKITVQEKKEKDEDIELLKNDRYEQIKIKNNYILKYEEIKRENEEFKEHINVLMSTLENMKDEEEQEYTYTLVYTYWCECDEIEKKYKQTGLLKEEYEEMYGMDSDNWISHTLLKEVR